MGADDGKNVSHRTHNSGSGLTLKEPYPRLLYQLPQPRATPKPIGTDINNRNRLLGRLESLGNVGDDVLEDRVRGEVVFLLFG